MICPHCAHQTTTVVEIESIERGTLRQRSCEACDFRFATLEQVPTTLVTVVKRDGRREPFQREKVLSGLIVSARKRPLPVASLEAIVEDIERRLLASDRSEVPSRVIGEMAIGQLKALDPIAYIRFSSAYRQFVSLDDMLDELSRMHESPLPPAEQGRLFADPDPLLAGERTADGELPTAPTPIGNAPSAAMRMGR